MSDDMQVAAVSPGEAERDVWKQVAEQCFAAWSKAPEHEKTSHLLTGPALAWAELELLANPKNQTLRYRLFLTQSLSHEGQEAEIPDLSAVAATQEGRRITFGLVASIVLSFVVLAPVMYLLAERMASNRSTTRLAQSEPLAPAVKEDGEGTRPPGLVLDGDREPPQGMSPHPKLAEQPVTPPEHVLAAPRNTETEPSATAPTIDPQLARQQERERLRQKLQRLVDIGNQDGRSHIGFNDVPDVAIELAERMLSTPPTDSQFTPEHLSALAAIFSGRLSLFADGIRDSPQREFKTQFCGGGRYVAGRHGGHKFGVWDARNGRPASSIEFDLRQGRNVAFDIQCKRLLHDTEDYNVEAISLGTGHRIAVYAGHEAAVTSLAYSHDGRAVLAASRDGTARIWDAASGTALVELRGHEGPLVGAAFDSNGERLATWAEDRTARIWDRVTGRQVAIMDQHNGIVTGAQFTASGNYVVTISVDGFARVWDRRSGALVTLNAKGTSIMNAAASHDDRFIAVATQNSSVEVWSLPTGTFVARLDSAGEPLRKFSFSPDSKSLATLSWHGRFTIWQPQSGRMLMELKPSNSSVKDFEFDPSGEHTIALAADGTITTWPSIAALTTVLDAARGGH